MIEWQWKNGEPMGRDRVNDLANQALKTILADPDATRTWARSGDSIVFAVRGDALAAEGVITLTWCRVVQTAEVPDE